MTHPLKPIALLLAIAALWLQASLAFGAPPIREQLPDEARLDWDAARELYDAGDARSALVHFQKAYDLSKNPRVLFNVGVCYKDLTQYARAIRVWERELAFSEKLDADDVAQIEFAIEAARRFVSSLTLQTNQPGATLSIDGTEVGTSPFVAAMPIDVGRRTLTLRKEGYAPQETTVDVVQGTPVSLTLNLTPLLKTGTVLISVSSSSGIFPGATLFMDGRELGTAPYRGEVPEGPHTFEARAPGFETARQTSEVFFGQTLQVSLSMAQSLNEGKVRIVTGYPDALISIDGEIKGSGSWEGILPVGGHQLRVEKSGYSTFTEEIALSRDQVRTVQVELSRKQNWVWWTVGIVAVVGGGAAAAVVLSQPTESAPVTGTLDTVSPRFP